MISRHDLIAAGGSFPVQSFSHNPESPPKVGSAMEGHRLHVLVANPARCKADVFSVDSTGNHRLILGQDLDERPGSNILERRETMAQFFDHGDPEAAQALRSLQGAPQGALAPWEGSSKVPSLSQDQIDQSGLNKDALLYVSAYAKDREAVRHYLDLGADPLHSIYDGDCAARLAVSLGFEELMTKEWVNGKDHQTGETGLHQLAAKDMVPELRTAISVGGRMEEQDNRGKSVWQHFRASSQEQRVRELMPLAMDAHAKTSHEDLNRALTSQKEEPEQATRSRRRM